MSKLVNLKNVEVNGKSYMLYLGVNQLINFEDIMEIPLQGITEEISQFKVMRTIIFVSGNGKNKNFKSLEEAGEMLNDWISEKGFEEVSSVISELMENAIPQGTPFQEQ